MSSYFQQVKCIMICFFFHWNFFPFWKKQRKPLLALSTLSFQSSSLFLPQIQGISFTLFSRYPLWGPLELVLILSFSFLQLLPPTSLIHFLEMFVSQVNHSWESEDCRALCIGKALSDALRRILSDCRGYLIQVRKYFPFLIISSYGKVVTLHFSLHEIDCSLFQLYSTL